VLADPEAAAEPQRYPKPANPAAYGQKYNSYCNPRKAPTCAKTDTETFCLKDTEYPEKEVKVCLVRTLIHFSNCFITFALSISVQYAIDYDPLVLKKYADIAEQSADNLVDGLTSLAEAHFDYSNYKGKFFEKGHWSGDEGYICPSDVVCARPLRAVNVDGEWRVIVQDIVWPGYTQTQRVEKCLFPGASCRTLAPWFGQLT